MLYSTIEETVTIDLPKGCTPGYFAMLPGKGNQAMIKGTDKFKNGDLYIDIDKISTGYFNVTKRGLELLVLMTPKEALEGFNRSLPMFPGSTIIINRLNKTTFPGTEVVLPGMGIPIANTDKRGNLYVTYEFEEDKIIDKDKISSTSVGVYGDEEIVDLDLLITTQEEYEKWYEKQKQINEQRRQDNIIKRILLKMKREMDRRKSKTTDNNSNDNSENDHNSNENDENNDDIREENS